MARHSGPRVRRDIGSIAQDGIRGNMLPKLIEMRPDFIRRKQR